MAAAIVGGIDVLQEEISRLEQSLQQFTLHSELVSQPTTSVELLESEGFKGPQLESDLPRQMQEAKARPEAERVRHAAAETEWKKEQQRLIVEIEYQRNSNEKALTTRASLEQNPEHSALVMTLQARADIFLRRNKAEFVERVFHKHADKDQKLILPAKLDEALLEFGVHLPADEVKALLITMDIDKNGGLDVKEFTAALRQPYTPAEQFLQTLPISGMLASCLVSPKASDSLKELCNLSSEQLKAAVHAFSVSLEQELKNQLDLLKSLVDAKEAKAKEEADGSGSKSAVFVMNAGSVKEFYEGPYERIGEHCLTKIRSIRVQRFDRFVSTANKA